MKFTTKKLMLLVFAACLSTATLPSLPVSGAPTDDVHMQTPTLFPDQQGNIVLSVITPDAQSDARWLVTVMLFTVQTTDVTGPLAPIPIHIRKGPPGTTHGLHEAQRGADWTLVALHAQWGDALGFTLATPRIKRDGRATQGNVYAHLVRFENGGWGRGTKVLLSTAYTFNTTEDVVFKEERGLLGGPDELTQLLTSHLQGAGG
jgi:hypothetical protein